MSDSSSQLIKKSLVFSTESPNLVFGLPETHPNKITVLGVSKDMQTIRVPLCNAFPAQNQLIAPAFSCRILLEFFNEDIKPIFYTTFKGCWTGRDSQKLMSVQQWNDPASGWYEGLIRNTDMGKAIDPQDIFPGESVYIDIACQFLEESSGFVWMDRSYFHVLAGKSPFPFEGACLVRLSVLGANVSEYTIFKIICNEDTFEGIPATTEEITSLTFQTNLENKEIW